MAVLAAQVFHFDLAHSPAAFLALPPSQQVAIGLIALMALSLMASAIWQSHRLARQLTKTLDELESNGGEKLSSRVEALAEAKRAPAQRIAQVREYFAELDSIRSEIAGTFANIYNALNKPG